MCQRPGPTSPHVLSGLQKLKLFVAYRLGVVQGGGGGGLLCAVLCVAASESLASVCVPFMLCVRKRTDVQLFMIVCVCL